MVCVKRLVLALMVLAVAAPAVLAGPNAGGVLVVHGTTLQYTTDVASYTGMSGVACGQDGPWMPWVTECPPYDPIGGATPCNPNAANPTLATPPVGESYVWYVMAAFSDVSCPRLKGVSFRIDYDPLKVGITSSGYDPEAFVLAIDSDLDISVFPAPGSGVGIVFPDVARTSRLQEVYWFAGYAYEGVTDATWGLRAKSNTDNFFVDDSHPAKTDRIAGFGRLGLGGTVGANPAPLLYPVGACCRSDGTCVVATEEDCAALGGLWSGVVDTCVPNPCPVAGACCNLWYGTCRVLTEGACAQEPYLHTFFSGASCDPNPCPVDTGACCYQDGSCAVTIQVYCGGTWFLSGVCDPNPCEVIPTERTSWGQIKNRFR